MPRIEHVVSSEIPNTFRVAKVQGMFDIPTSDRQEKVWSVDVPGFDEDWGIGAIVGPSGTGKTQIAKAAFGANVIEPRTWPQVPLIDAFGSAFSIQEIVGSLNAAGLSTTPSWLLPYSALSNGQRFRAELADAMLSHRHVVFDEFTSVVDRTVAKSSATSISKWVRRTPEKRFVAVTCHYDILEWLEPDWVLDMATGETVRGRLRRPPIEIVIVDGGRSEWPRFRPYHYLTGDLHKSCRAFTAWVGLDGAYELAGFFSLLPVAGHKGWWRGHRTVVLPDYQGMGIGNRMIETVAEKLYTHEGKRFRATTSSVPLVEHRKRNPHMWKLAQAPNMKPVVGKTSSLPGMTSSAGRLTTTWVYIPEALRRPNGSAR